MINERHFYIGKFIFLTLALTLLSLTITVAQESAGHYIALIFPLNICLFKNTHQSIALNILVPWVDKAIRAREN